LWHERTGRPEFRDHRLQAEALILAQEDVLREIDELLGATGIPHVIFKGAANRLLLYASPAIRACHDLDILVNAEDRVRAATALSASGFAAVPNLASISRELMLIRGAANVDLHWEILREGRLRDTSTAELLERRRRIGGSWMLDADDNFFALLVHSAFAKHLGSWELGLHRVADILQWIRTQEIAWPVVRARLAANGVVAAAWATLRWVELLAEQHAPQGLVDMARDLEPGRVRRSWIDRWLHEDLPGRAAEARWTRLLGFSMFLHDTVADAVRAAAGRARARRRSADDLAAFGQLLD
jgi:hypothetical protein